MNIDRAELRRRNMVTSVPFISPTGTPVDSGQFSDNLDAAIRRTDGFESRRKESEARGLLRGFGFAYHIKGTGGPPEENVELTFGEDDTVTLTTGLDTLVFQLNVLTSKLELDFTSPIECKHSTAVTGALSAGTGVGKINVFGYQA